MIDVQPRIDAAVNEKISLLLPQIRLEERTRLGHVVVSVPVLTSTDEEFESFIEQVLASNNINQLNIILERLREKTVYAWGAETAERLSTERMLEIKRVDFVPALRRLVLLGLLLLKFSSPVSWFEKVGDLLVQIFCISELLGRRIAELPREAETASIDSHSSHTVPALEALVASFVLVGFELTRGNRIEFVRTLFPRIVDPIAGPGEHWRNKGFFLFWEVTTGWGYPNRRRDLLAVERYSRGDRIEQILGGSEGLTAAVLQCDCLVDWHSFISLPQSDYGSGGEPETVNYFKTAFPNVSTTFYPNFSHEPLRIVVPLVQKLWRSFQTREHGYWAFSEQLSKVLQTIDVTRRQNMLIRFVKYGQRMHNERMFGLNRFPFRTYWPEEIAERLRDS